jgi:arylsulfatase A
MPRPFALILPLLALPLLAIAAPPSSAPSTQPATRPIAQSSDGSVLLHARDVTIHGTTVRYEPKPEKNTIGFWTKKEDWVSWDFEITRPGRFRVLILQGCGKGSGGAEVAFSVDDAQTLKHSVEDTGGFQNFVEHDIGTMELAAGKHTLSVKPQSKPGRAVMDLRQVVLKPAN